MRHENMDANDSSEMVENVNEQLQKVKNKSSEFLKNAGKEISDRYYDMEDSIVTYIQRNPWKAVGISLLSGYVLSIILRK